MAKKGNKTEVVQFDPQDSPSISAAFAVMENDSHIPRELVEQLRNALGAYISGGAAAQAVLSKTKQLNHAVLSDVGKRNEIVAVKGVSKYYRRQLDPETNTPTDEVYRPVDKETLVNEITRSYEDITGTVDGNAVDNLWNSMDKKIRKDNTVQKVDNTLIQLLSGLFWNTSNGDTYDGIPEGMKCFRRLFDTSSDKIKHVVKYEEHDFDGYAEVLLEYIDETYEELSEKDGDLEEDEDFEFLRVVSCHEHDRYMDIIRMFATFFMKKKPLGAYILEGNGRNGKSALIGLIHTIMGENNTSRLQLAELGNWHKNHCLADTLVNAPDEEKKKTLEDTDLFRVIADHGVIELDVMHGQQPISVACDFQCVSASNHLPNWEGPDAEACIRRARIIPFQADLSGEDAKNIDFEKITYTPERVIHFLGVVLGVARYYMDRPFPESNGIEVMRNVLQENMVSYRLYYNSFVGFFGKYHLLRDVYTDYTIWCKDKGYKISKYEDFTEAFNASRSKPTSYTDSRVTLKNVYRVSNAQQCFHKGWMCPEATSYGTLEQMHDTGISALTLLENLKEQELSRMMGGENE